MSFEPLRTTLHYSRSHNMPEDDTGEAVIYFVCSSAAYSSRNNLEIYRKGCMLNLKRSDISHDIKHLPCSRISLGPLRPCGANCLLKQFHLVSSVMWPNCFGSPRVASVPGNLIRTSGIYSNKEVKAASQCLCRC